PAAHRTATLAPPTRPTPASATTPGTGPGPASPVDAATSPAQRSTHPAAQPGRRAGGQPSTEHSPGNRRPQRRTGLSAGSSGRLTAGGGFPQTVANRPAL